MAGRDPFAQLVPPAAGGVGDSATAPSAAAVPPPPPPPAAAAAQLASGVAGMHLHGAGGGASGANGGGSAPPAVTASPSAADWTSFPIQPGGAALFAEADADGDGVVGRADAKAFFARTGVPGATLAQVRPALCRDAWRPRAPRDPPSRRSVAPSLRSTRPICHVTAVAPLQLPLPATLN